MLPYAQVAKVCKRDEMNKNEGQCYSYFPSTQIDDRISDGGTQTALSTVKEHANGL